MSLTSELSDPKSPLRRFMERRFPNVDNLQEPWRRRMKAAPTIRPAQPVHWSTSGTALNYRIHFALGDTARLVARLGADLWVGQALTPAAVESRIEAVKAFFPYVHDLVVTHRPSAGRVDAGVCERLCRA